ncbi:MAG: leucine-rich repeat domain-containing protein [Rubricoccaceae bacterium]|nr:leucine-rich repeat domain-containing protein [Rubricoccaceae bacterium]
MSPLLATVLVVLAVVVAWQLLARRHLTLADLAGRASPEEVEAVDRLFAAAGVGPRGVLLVEVDDPDAPCWAVRWGWPDRLLRTSRRFGAYASGLRCVGVYQGAVVGVSLVSAPLADTGPLTWLHGLRTLRLHSAGLDALPTLPRPCGLVRLDLAENRLPDLDALPPCPDLRRLDVPRNRLRRLPPLDGLPALERLDASANEISDARPLAGHPALEQVFLSANDLVSAEGLAGLPRLGYLGLGSNPIASPTASPTSPSCARSA